MKTEDLPVLAHHWKVQFTLPMPANNPAFPGWEYERTAFIGVIASTIDECISQVRRTHPRATIYTVSHQGKIQLDGLRTEAPK